MQITLTNMTIENFKGIRYHRLEPNGRDTTIYAENGVGKTTVYDAFLWLFFGKNSAGDTQFDICPLDENNNRIKGLVVAVEAMLEIDGVERLFRKEQHEKVVKGQLTGYEAKCSIDEVPKKKGEYESYIAETISEDVFKMLTNLQHFNTMPWTDRRKILLDVAGEIGTPSGFTELTSRLKGRSIKDYKDVLNAQKKAYKDERDDINPRLDEINIGIGKMLLNVADGDIEQGGDVIAGTVDVKGAGDRRAIAIKAQSELAGKRKKITDDEAVRQQKIEDLNELKLQQRVLEDKLGQGDTSKIGPLLKEKLVWDEKLSKARDGLADMQTSIRSTRETLAGNEECLRQKSDRWGLVSDNYRELKAAELNETCSACGQSLPTDKIESLRKAKDEKLERTTANATGLKKEHEGIEIIVTKQRELLGGLLTKAIAREQRVSLLEADRAEAIIEIDKKIAACKDGIDPEQDDEWKRLNSKIEAAAAAIGPSAFDQTITIDAQINACIANIAEANTVLNSADRIESDRQRIAVLEQREKELAQLIADIEAQLQQIDEYGAEESRLIEAAVNDMFMYTTFKLFNRRLNESIEPTCTAMLNGKPYRAMSTGERIFVGVDIINTLSEFYGYSVVMFLDHRESLTMPIETDAQVISLFAEKGTKELTVR